MRSSFVRILYDFALIDICGDIANNKSFIRFRAPWPSISELLVLLLVYPSDDSRFER